MTKKFVVCILVVLFLLVSFLPVLAKTVELLWDIPYEGDVYLVATGNILGNGYEEIVVDNPSKECYEFLKKENAKWVKFAELSNKGAIRDVGDTDGDGKDEVFLLKEGKLYRYTWNGNKLVMDTPITTDKEIYDIKIGDIDNDGQNEVVGIIVYYNEEHLKKKQLSIWKFNKKFSLIWQGNDYWRNDEGISSPHFNGISCIGDIKGIGKNKIVLGWSGGEVVIIRAYDILTWNGNKPVCEKKDFKTPEGIIFKPVDISGEVYFFKSISDGKYLNISLMKMKNYEFYKIEDLFSVKVSTCRGNPVWCNLGDGYGILIGSKFYKSTIPCFASTDEILKTYPGDGVNYVPLDSKIKLFFNGERNKSDYSFNFTPSLEGTVSSYENAIIFTPGNSLKKSTEYKVTIKNNKDGSSYSWSFTTNSTSLPPAKGPKDEKLIGIALGDSVSVVLNLLGEPERKSEPQFQGFNGTMGQMYVYTSKGIEVFLETSDRTPPYEGYQVSKITITSPCTEGTLREIKIGDPESKVKANYMLNYGWKDRPVKNGDNLANKTVFCGDVYYGVMFRFDENGNVKEIAIGSFAE